MLTSSVLDKSGCIRFVPHSEQIVPNIVNNRLQK
jgi:hypothetical protein